MSPHPAAPLFLFAPGAGANSRSAWMQRYAQALSQLGRVQLLDYPYQHAGRKLPDPLPKLVAAHSAALHAAQADHLGKVFLVGKSMGGRVGCHVALTEAVDGLVCLGYPLCGAGNRTKLRDAVLLQLNTPVLFVQGTRDELCPLELLEPVRKKMTAPSTLFVVEGADHSLQLTQSQLKSTGTTQAAIDALILEQVRSFVAKL